MKRIKALLLISLLILSTGVMFAQKNSNLKPEGTWTFTAPDAPYEYSKGDIVITKEGQELEGELIFSEYSKTKLNDLKLENDILTFNVYVEGSLVKINVTVTKNEMTGKVTHPEGTLEISAERKKK